jgi:CMP/dCMP kinase
MNRIIAIDGPAASGKGTLARRLAAFYKLPHLDTGLLYRGVARAVLDEGLSLENEAVAVHAAHILDLTRWPLEALRARSMSDAASKVAQFTGVRAALLDTQRRFANQNGGAVLDGRDIGTVVCPQARVKLFVTASAEERARRRFRELQASDATLTYEIVLDAIRARDARDANREAAPLAMAAGAFVINTTDLNPDLAEQSARTHVESCWDC